DKKAGSSPPLNHKCSQCSLPRSALYPLFNLRQANNDRIADSLQTLRGDFIERVVLCMPGIVSAQLNNIERRNAGAQEWRVIVVAYAFRSIDELLAITDLLRGLPHDVLQPGRA